MAVGAGRDLFMLAHMAVCTVQPGVHLAGVLEILSHSTMTGCTQDGVQVTRIGNLNRAVCLMTFGTIGNYHLIGMA